ncbi:hypothetical protein [Stratiformator vulcanicus]|uniref:MraY-like glycosyltransferase n=1 Tax=Stratiformator vulcanicus TaxID=2527980 RepID=A0A517QVR2_9PLAN|nr:hypothetical protein [Stratiformator vulcanicus]QDT35657.1 MraY-like glycosyltransferase [Stratiformator vulcanicus]
MKPSRQQLALICLAISICGSTGCVYSSRYVVTRCWADKNTLREPALFVEQIHHLPPTRADAEHYRWSYNAGPGSIPVHSPPAGASWVSAEVPAAATEPVLKEPVMNEPVDLRPPVDSKRDDSLPPLPAKANDTAAQSSPPVRGAWLFRSRG